jgi:hypothetical protein
VSISAVVDSDTPLLLFPTQSDGNAAYVFDTSVLHTTGDLAQFGNAGTNQFTIAHDTGIGAADGSKVFANDGMFHAVSAVVTNQFVPATIDAQQVLVPRDYQAVGVSNGPSHAYMLSYATNASRMLMHAVGIGGLASDFAAYAEPDGTTEFLISSPSSSMTWTPAAGLTLTKSGGDEQILFGSTNSLYRSGTDLIITNGGNGSTIGGLRMMTGDGSSNFITASGNLCVIKGVGGVGLFDSLSGGDEVRWFANQFIPLVAGATLGQDAAANASPNQWGKVSAMTNFVNGFTTAVLTNYSRGSLSHGGSNDFFYVDSEGAGTAGGGRPILVRVGIVTGGITTKTNIIQFDGNSGASTTGVLIYENGSAKRVTVGANDSGGAGFRVLRIPN